MKFLIVGLQKGSQITRLTKEAQKLGHEVFGCKTSDLIIKSGEGKFEASVNGESLSGFDLIYLCAGIESKKRYEWYIACDYLLKHARTKVVNDVVINPKNKYYPVQTWFFLKQFEKGIPQVLTYSIFNDKNLGKIAEDLGFPAILKLSETHQGKGTYLVNSASEIKNIMSKNLNQTYLLRKFISNDGDIRVFVIGGRAIGAMKRIPAKGEFRSNISVGGSGKPFDLDRNRRIKKLAENAAEICGIEIAGVDIIIDKKSSKSYVLEVNTGPQFKGLEKYTGINVAGEVIKYFVSKCK